MNPCDSERVSTLHLSFLSLWDYFKYSVCLPPDVGQTRQTSLRSRSPLSAVSDPVSPGDHLMPLSAIFTSDRFSSSHNCVLTYYVMMQIVNWSRKLFHHPGKDPTLTRSSSSFPGPCHGRLRLHDRVHDNYLLCDVTAFRPGPGCFLPLCLSPLKQPSLAGAVWVLSRPARPGAWSYKYLRRRHTRPLFQRTFPENTSPVFQPFAKLNKVTLVLLHAQQLARHSLRKPDKVQYQVSRVCLIIKGLTILIFPSNQNDGICVSTILWWTL